MFTYEIVGFGSISSRNSKNLLIVHLKYLREGVTGYAVETIFVRQDCIEGGLIDVGKLCKVYRDSRGYTQGIELI